MNTIDIQTFSEIRLDTGGMLDPKIYYELYLAAQRAEKTILEIGTYNGGGTISLALGAKEDVKVVTLERFGDFMAGIHGDEATYNARLRQNFKQYGVSEKIESHIGEPGSLVDNEDIADGIGLLLLDADGAIDRDFSLFHHLLVPEAPIIIDDYGDEFADVRFNLSRIGIGQKRRLTRMLVDYYENLGYIEKEKVIGDTYFGRKHDSPTASANRNEIIQFYRKLIWVTAKPSSAAYNTASRMIKSISPRSHLWLKSMMRRG